jgi:hypothetical protein
MAGPHDVGGQAAGPVDRAEHDAAFWEKEVDAIQVLLSDDTRRIVGVDELRRGIESLGPEAYDTLSYYERWIASIASILVEKGILSEAEIAERVSAIRARSEAKA